ncbi:MAG: YpiB family protein [Bacillota bacterium]
MKKNTLTDKRNLIQWFLDSQRLAAPKAEKVLRLLLDSDSLLKKISLMPEITATDNLLLISSRATQRQPFLLKMNGQKFYEVEAALNALKNEEWEYLYLHLAINKTLFCQHCAIRNNEENKKVEKRRKQLIRQMLLQMIDQALDFRDQRAFEVLTNKLKEIETEL